MKLIQLMMLLVVCMGVANAQEVAALTGPVSIVEIQSLADKVHLDGWAMLAKKSTFGDEAAILSNGRSGRGVGAQNFESYWAVEKLGPLDDGKLRDFKTAWSPEKTTAQALLQRPVTSAQKKWLESFIETADALAAKDAKKFKELVIPLADDARTLL